MINIYSFPRKNISVVGKENTAFIKLPWGRNKQAWPKRPKVGLQLQQQQHQQQVVIIWKKKNITGDGFKGS